VKSVPSTRIAQSAPAAIVFDCDGLLVDTETCWTRAESAVFAEHGFSFGLEQKALLIGRTIEASSDAMADYFGRRGEGAAVAADLLARVGVELELGANPLPGAVELVRACAERVPVAVASNSPRFLLDVALQGSGLAELLPISLAADEVERPKPDPELYLAACALLGAAPELSVAFEDSGTGAAAARAAGLFVITVPSLPGSRIDHDWQLSSLADPALLRWVASLTPVKGAIRAR